jgi:hypothetical protein
MSLKWKIVALALPVVFLAACKDQPSAPTATPQQTHALAADFTNNADGGGPWIARYTNDQFWGFFDSNDGLVRAWFSTLPLDGQIWVQDPDGNTVLWPWDNAVCGPTGTSAVHQQQISHWDATHTDLNAVWITNVNGPVWIALTSRADDAVGPCAGRPLIGSGWGQVHYNDNNQTGAGRPQDAWSWRLVGMLMGVDGKKFNFSGHVSCVGHNYFTTLPCHTEFNF